MNAWFLAIAFFGGNPATNERIAMNMGAQHYPTHAACMADARDRTAGLAEVGMHGRYLCMFHGEGDMALEATVKAAF